MFREVISWDIYEVSSTSTPLTGVMLRGRIRKFCLEHQRNVLAENAQDSEGTVRFALPSGEGPTELITYLQTIISDVEVKRVLEGVLNPVLSKLKVNIESRYTL